MIICFFQQQVKLLFQQDSFEVDMSFKRIRQKDINEIIFANLIPSHGKIITWGRILTNMDSVQGYQLAFERFFSTASKVAETPVKWKHVHETAVNSFSAVVMDMCPKQMKGFGRYLKTVDPQRRSWDWHARRTVIFCRVHFFRSIEKLIREDEAGLTLRSRLRSLLTCKTRDEYYQLCDLITEHERVEIQQWVRHKRHPVIAAGLNRACSDMDPNVFDSVLKHTNAVEQAANKSYAPGKRQDLLIAIKHAQTRDKRDLDQYRIREDHNMTHVQRNTTLQARYEEQMRKDKRIQLKRRRVEPSLDHNDDEILTLASSSGYVRTPSRRGSRSPALRARRSESVGTSNRPIRYL
ncbi:hypothetical protein P152DRAFT_256677 [Eremomyces bilateralis CBS 781.70]|uniref:MULE transposase domain-containing protein n=1 Tax=Eremomyces bilateralis CBS 781.70 TaxID=1392243 RepID=A0A6G1FQV2_9PEZI|nr:uncharacterized protein P152DRAFT_256677 [Eremomyces bilateralis CBS 781.70]KAF1808090.1 hypothetical protein P152DRAFT_256677 [Eremomyces bilateralis CBS 781.70]